MTLGARPPYKAALCPTSKYATKPPIHSKSPVEFGLWRLMMRPVDTHAVRVVEPRDYRRQVRRAGRSRLWQFGVVQPGGAAQECAWSTICRSNTIPRRSDMILDATAVVDDDESRNLVLGLLDSGDGGGHGAYRAWLAAHAPLQMSRSSRF